MGQSCALWHLWQLAGVAGYKITLEKEQLLVGQSHPMLCAIRLPGLSAVPGDAPAPCPTQDLDTARDAGSGCRDVL